MRVCVLCPGWPGKVNPWNGIFIKGQATSLSNLNCDTSVVTARVFKEDLLFRKDGNLKVYRFWFPSQRKLLAEYGKIPVVRIGFYLISGILKTLRVVRKEHCDLIHAHWVIPTGFIAVIAGKMLGKPVIITAHDADITTLPQRSKIAARIIRFTLHHADLIISVSQTLNDTIKRNLAIGSEKVRIIPLGIDQKRFKGIDKQMARHRLNLPERSKIVLFVGALLEVKGLSYLFEAIPQVATRHKEALFVLIGQGPLEAELKAKAKNLNLEDRVKIEGSKSHEEIPLWVSAADILILPSLSEGLPMTVLEALAVGLPVVASRVGALPEVVRNGQNGMLIDPGNSGSIVQTLDSILEDETLLSNLRSGAALPPQYNLHEVAQEIKGVYQQVIARQMA